MQKPGGGKWPTAPSTITKVTKLSHFSNFCLSMEMGPSRWGLLPLALPGNMKEVVV